MFLIKFLASFQNTICSVACCGASNNLEVKFNHWYLGEQSRRAAASRVRDLWRHADYSAHQHQLE